MVMSFPRLPICLVGHGSKNAWPMDHSKELIVDVVSESCTIFILPTMLLISPCFRYLIHLLHIYPMLHGIPMLPTAKGRRLPFLPILRPARFFSWEVWWNVGLMIQPDLPLISGYFGWGLWFSHGIANWILLDLFFFHFWLANDRTPCLRPKKGTTPWTSLGTCLKSGLNDQPQLLHLGQVTIRLRTAQCFFRTSTYDVQLFKYFSVWASTQLRICLIPIVSCLTSYYAPEHTGKTIKATQHVV